jgi:hypothetical protein
MKFFAVPYGPDGLTGDSSFYPSKEDAVKLDLDKITFEGLLSKYSVGLDDDETPIGFWILSEKDLDTALTLFEVECGNDSQCYTINRSVKTLCNRLAVRTVGAPVPEL